MRIAVFCSNYPPHPGGLEIVAHRIAAGLAARHEVVVVTSAWNGMQGRSDEDGLVVYRLPTVHASERWGVPYPVPVGPGVRAALAAVTRAHVVHAHGALYASTLLAAGTARRRRQPFVLTEHVGFVEYRNAALDSLQRAAWSSIGRFVVGAARAVAVYNARVFDWLGREYPRADIRFIPNGVDPQRFHPRSAAERASLRQLWGLPEHEPLVLFVGRDVQKKNLDAVLRIPRDEFVLVVCGAERRLEEERVIDLGVVPYARMPDVFGAVDLVIHASTGEGFPLAVQEAMAGGVPPVLLWDEGYGRMLDRGVVEAAPTLADLSSRLIRLVRDPTRRAELGRTGRRWAEDHWEWSGTVRAYEGLFEAVSTKASGGEAQVVGVDRS